MLSRKDIEYCLMVMWYLHAILKGKQFLNQMDIWLFSIRYKGKSISVLVHKLCAFQKYGYIAFSYECIRHLDGNRTNNILENIEIGSYSDNQLDKSPEERKREATIASHSHIMKWNEEEVAMIKNYHKTSHSYRKTMTRFGISSKGTLHFILKNR
jgi:hypothetical protein